jgi:hypothetical protein
MELRKRHLQMIKARGFDRIFENERLEYDTDTACFQKLNEEYKNVFGMKRYANFKSFHSARWARLNS